MLAGLKRFILWDYPRGGWQYDVMCALIVLFIFGAPRQWFHDQPRIPRISEITSLPSHGESLYLIETELISSVPESERGERLAKVLTARNGRKQEVTRIEPIFNSENEIKGYVVSARP